MVEILLAFALAQNLPLQINEIMYNPPGNDDGFEWIEVKNVSNNTLYLKSQKSGWRIFDGENHLFKNDLTILPGEIFVIVQNENNFRSKYPNFSSKLVVANFNLKNSSQEIKIFDENKNLLGQAFYDSKFGANGNGFTLIFDGEKFIEGRIEGGTPGKENIIQNKIEEKETITTSTATSQTPNTTTTISTITITTTTTPSSEVDNQKEDQWQNLVINEIFPNPEKPIKDIEGEFIEIFNEGEEKVNLEGIELIVGDKKIKLKGEIGGKEYLVIKNKDYKFMIKNDGDKISLVKDSQKIHEISFFEKAPEGLSLSRFQNGWFWVLPTPGEENKKREKLVQKNLGERLDDDRASLNKNIFSDEKQNELVRKIEKDQTIDKTSNNLRRLLDFLLPLIFVISISFYILWKHVL
jgi:hypothetical protein